MLSLLSPIVDCKYVLVCRRHENDLSHMALVTVKVSTICNSLNSKGNAVLSGLRMSISSDTLVLNQFPRLDKFRMNTVFIRIVAAATINFSLAWVRLLIEGGFY